MKTVLNISLALFILLASIGVSINKMICLESGNVEVSLLEMEDCCGDESSTDYQSLEDECCDFSTDYFQISFPSVVFYQFIKVASVDLMGISNHFNIFNYSTLNAQHSTFISASPSLINPTSPNFIGIFRI